MAHVSSTVGEDFGPASRFSRAAAAGVDLVFACVPGVLLAIGLLPLLGGGVLAGVGVARDAALEKIAGGALGLFGTVFVVLGLVALVLLLLYQWALLALDSATIGMRMFGVRIVHAETLARAHLLRALVLRSWVFGLFCIIPYVGPFIAVLDLLFILGPERRCLHDYLAGTRVHRFKPRTSLETGAAVVVGLAAVVVVAGAAFGAVKVGGVVRDVVKLVGGHEPAPTTPPPAPPTTAPTTPPTTAPPAPPTTVPRYPVGPVIVPITVPITPTIPPPTPTPTTPPPASTPPPPPASTPPTTAPAAQYWVYTDDDGVGHIVKSVDDVPAKYRSRAHAD